MNLKEVKKIVYVDILIICFTIICLVFSLCYILFGDINVKADTLDLAGYSYCYSNSGSAQRWYVCTDAAKTDCSCRAVGSIFSGKAYFAEFYLRNYTFNANTKYSLTLQASSNDWRNTINDRSVYNVSSSSSINHTYTFLSKNKIKLTFTPTSQTNNIKVTLQNSSNSAITGDTNFGLYYITLDFSGPNDAIIQNQNSNTEDIINNANENTEQLLVSLGSLQQDISGDLQSQTDKLLANTTCPVGPLSINFSNWSKQNGYLDSSGNVITGNGGISTYFEVLPNSDYVITANNSISGAYYCIYTSQKTLITCYQMNNTILTLHTSSRTSFLRMSINKNTSYTLNGPVCNDWTKEEQQATNQSLNEINDYLSDNSDPTINNSGIDSVLSSVQIDDPLNYLLTLPINLLQKLNTVLSSNSCQRVSFGSLYDTELYLPCINFSQLIGTDLWNTIDLFVGVGLLAVILKKFYESISNILTMGKEKEVKDKLDLPTPMQFLASILGGGKE